MFTSALIRGNYGKYALNWSVHFEDKSSGESQIAITLSKDSS